MAASISAMLLMAAVYHSALTGCNRYLSAAADGVPVLTAGWQSAHGLLPKRNLRESRPELRLGHRHHVPRSRERERVAKPGEGREGALPHSKAWRKCFHSLRTRRRVGHTRVD